MRLHQEYREELYQIDRDVRSRLPSDLEVHDVRRLTVTADGELRMEAVRCKPGQRNQPLTHEHDGQECLTCVHGTWQLDDPIDLTQPSHRANAAQGLADQIIDGLTEA